MTKTEFIDWKRHPVTQQVFSQLQDRINALTETLVINAGQDPYNDAKHSGAIQAYGDLINIDYEEETQ